MSEDEALLRGVIDRPGDDTARLVYADWLDERDDPRGAYLRAEREAAATGDASRLTELAIGLDPVWVARVTLSPLGVCLNEGTLTDRGAPITRSDIARVEGQLGVHFPPDYVAFLLNYNGGWIGLPNLVLPSGEEAPSSDGGWRLSPLLRVSRFSLREGDLIPTEGILHFPPPPEPLTNWLARVVCIGRDPDHIGGIFLSVCEPDVGQVRVLDTSIELEVSFRYNSQYQPSGITFTEFLSGLPRSVWSYPPTTVDDDDAIPF